MNFLFDLQPFVREPNFLVKNPKFAIKTLHFAEKKVEFAIVVFDKNIFCNSQIL